MRTTEEINEICKKALEEYLSTPEKERSLTKLQTKYGIKRQTLSERFKKWGYEVVNLQNRLRIDETVFDVIDTEEKAYWLGFLYADENIGTNEHKLEMNLSAKDAEHMIKFQKFLKYTENKLRTRENFGRGEKQVRFSIRNKHMWNALNSKGCVPCKSLILEFPNKEIFKDRNLIFDFIRGYIDGDGYVGIMYNKEKTTKRMEINIVGTEKFLNGVYEFLGISEYIRNKSTKNYQNKAYVLMYNGVKARQVARLLYENSTIYLERKYNKYLEYCRIEEESSKRKSSKIGRDWNVNTELNSEITKGSESV